MTYLLGLHEKKKKKKNREHTYTTKLLDKINEYIVFCFGLTSVYRIGNTSNLSNEMAILGPKRYIRGRKTGVTQKVGYDRQF